RICDEIGSTEAGTGIEKLSGSVIYPEFTKQIMLSGSCPPAGGHQFESGPRYSLKLQFTN
ncbi:hypothetical protein ACR78B_19740, partial [Sphingobacterium spiritivorum]|uniref:hypothetical protein n=1 Tax=Sphingobacterium spiritivorum TaxID=258 RepID=UPI003DA26818